MKHLIFIIFGICISCYPNPKGDFKFFFEKESKRKLVCDTINDERFQNGYRLIEIFEESSGRPVTFEGQKYYDYMLSLKEDDKSILITHRNNKIYLKQIGSDQSQKYPEEILVDLNSVGAKWKITYGGGLLSNSILTLDSITNSQDDKFYHLNVERIFDVTDQIFISNLILSEKNGFEKIVIVDGQAFGDSVICFCRP